MRVMRVTLVIFSLGAGGAERVMTTLANAWAEKGWDVHLLTLDACVPFFELHPSVAHQSLDLSGVSSSPFQGLLENARRIRVLRSAIKKTRPDVVISFMSTTNVITLIAVAGLGVPVIVSERVDPHCHSIGKVWGILRRWLYPHAAQLVAQSDRALQYFPHRIRKRSRVIPNPVHSIQSPKAHIEGKGIKKTIITIGRLDEQKGFDLLITAFGKIALRHPNWTLDIWGGGPLHATLDALIEKLGLGGRVQLCGQTQQAVRKLCEADLYVMSSRYEGFPNALCEAMASGLPVISFDCPSGPREVIRNGVDGILVGEGDINGLACAMEGLISDEGERRRLAARAPEVAERFSLNRVVETWEELIRELVIVRR